MDYVVSTLRSKTLRVLLAAVLALGLVPSLSVSKAFAAEPKFIGTVYYPVAYDENGFPLYNEDGTYQREAPYVTLNNVENVSGTLVIPETFDVVERLDDGTEKVEKNVTPHVLYLEGRAYDGPSWTNQDVNAIDITKGQSLVGVSISAISSIEAVNITGLANLVSARFSECESLRSVTVEDCPKFDDYSLDTCKALALPDFAKQPWSGLTSLSLNNRSDLTTFDASILPQLTRLTIQNTGLTLLDVSRNERLQELTVMFNRELTKLDATAIPESVTRFECRYNNIQNTAALVDRFGKEVVLPQQSEPASAAGLFVINERAANGTVVAGDAHSFSLVNTYRPSGDEYWNYWGELDEVRNAITNYRAVSSDPSIATVELTDVNDIPMLKVTGKKAGTAKLTIDYRFEGTRATYEGRQDIDFTIVPTANPITSVACEASVDVPFVSKCAICGENHQSVDGGISVPIQITTQDPSRLPTGSAHVEVVSADTGVVYGSYQVESNGASGEYSIRLNPHGLGSTTVTLTGITYIGGSPDPIRSEPVTMQVNVVEAKPTLKVAESTTAYLTEYFESSVSNLGTVVSAYGEVASYVEDAALAEITKWHSNQFVYGNPVVSADCPDVYTATSDNEDIVAIVWDQHIHTLSLEHRKAGTANVTVKDVWGNTGTCAVTVVDKKEEAKKLSLSQNEITIKQGETFDLSTLVQGLEDLPPYLASASLLLVFKSSNGYIVPITSNDTSGLDNPVYVSQILGRNVGTVTISANMLTGNDMAGAFDYIDQWEVTQFDTLTVHVVDSDEPTGNPATSVEVTGDSNQVVMGSTLQLSAAITPANADNAGDLAWSSSDEAVATVDASGKVTPVAPGKTTITATVGDVSGTFEVTVVAKSIPATKVVIDSYVPTMWSGISQQLNATVEPADTTEELVWSTSDEAVLTVDQSGLVTAVGNGEAYITATAGRATGQTGMIYVTTQVEEIVLDASELQIYLGAEPTKLGATVLPPTASDKSVTWSSSDEAIASVDDQGNVSPVSVGKAVITATAANGLNASCIVIVKQRATGLELNTNEAIITGADTVKLKATVEPDNATNKNVTWTSSDPGVATVDVNGVVTSVAKGTATITATSEDGSFTDTCTVTVSNPVTSITVEPTSLNLIKGEAASVLTVLAGELSGAVDDGEVTWESSDSSIASVDGGAVTALKSGSATITAKAGALSAACTVKVTNPVKAVSISETSKTVTVGDEPFTLTATVDPVDADDTTITWTSSNPKVATVDEQGNVTIKAAGTASIVASAGGVSASCALTVDAKVVAQTPADSGFAASVSATDSETAAALENLQQEGGLNLVMDAIEELTESAKGAIDKLTAAGEAVAEVFDIHFAKDNGDEVVLSSKDGEVLLTVKVRLTDSMRALLDQGMELKVSYVGDDGTIEEKETWVEGDSLYFVTSHFSDYVVTGVPKPVGSEDDGGQGQTPGQGTGTQPMAKTDGGDTGSKLAPTGDPLTVVPIVLGAFACIAAGAVVLSRRKVR